MKVLTKLKSTFLLLTAALAITMYSCSKEEDTTETPKTLDKSKLYDKKWYSESQLYTHEIKSTGVYGSDGSWKWINNSDTMEIIYWEGQSPVKWKFHWSSDREMSCNIVCAANTVLFKDAPW
jgi:hypothetical protein